MLFWVRAVYTADFRRRFHSTTFRLLVSSADSAMSWRDGIVEDAMCDRRQSCLVVCDFDSTLTKNDTTGSIVKIAARKIGIEKDYRDFMERWCETERMYFNELSKIDFEGFHNMPSLRAFLDYTFSVEDKSTELVQGNGFLRGLQREEIRKSCASDPSLVELRDGALEFLQDYKECANIQVLSVNWSRDLIFEGLGRKYRNHVFV